MATYPDPRQFPLGIVHVIVNGRPVVRDGIHTGALAGEPLSMMTGSKYR